MTSSQNSFSGRDFPEEVSFSLCAEGEAGQKERPSFVYFA
jgi:hypothetical protein